MAEISSSSQQLQYLARVQDQIQARKNDAQRIGNAERASDAKFDADQLRGEELRRNSLQADRQLSLDERERARSAQLEVDLRRSQLNKLDNDAPQRDDLPRGSLIDINA